MTDKIILGIISILVPAAAIICFRYYLFDKLPKWARLTYRVIFYTAAFILIMTFLVKLAA